MTLLAAVLITALLVLVSLLIYGSFAVQRESPSRWIAWGVAVAGAFFVTSGALLVWQAIVLENPAAAAQEELISPDQAAAITDPYEALGPAVAAHGRKLYLASGCHRCHSIGAGAMVGPDLIDVSSRYDEAFLVRWILDPEGIYRELGVSVVNPEFPPMPAIEIGEEEALRIAQYLRSFPRKTE